MRIYRIGLNISLFLFLVLVFPAFADWREDVFNESQDIMRKYDKEEATLMCRLDPRLTDYYKNEIAMREADRKLYLIAFLKRLRSNPDSIKWGATWGWMDSIKSSDEMESMAKTDPVFHEAYDDFLKKRGDWHNWERSLRIRNAVYKKHSLEFSKIEKESYRAINDLQKRVNKLAGISSPPAWNDYKSNTIFPGAPYTEKGFRKIRIGMTKYEVRSLLGEPLIVENVPFLNCILYSQENYKLDYTAAWYHGVDSSDVKDHSAPGMVFWFSENGGITHFMNLREGNKPIEQNILKLHKKDVLRIFGLPKDEILVEPCYVYSYTKLRDNCYIDINWGIYLRRIYFDGKDRVKKIVSKKAPANEKY